MFFQVVLSRRKNQTIHKTLIGWEHKKKSVRKTTQNGTNPNTLPLAVQENVKARKAPYDGP